MRLWIGIVVAFTAPGSLAAPPGEPREEFLDVLRVGDRVALRSQGEIVLGSDEEIDALLPTDDERREYESMSVPGRFRLPLPNELGLEAMWERVEENRKQMARLSELGPKGTTTAVRLTEVGWDFVAYEKEDGHTVRLSSRALSQISGPRDLLAARQSAAPRGDEGVGPSAPLGGPSKFLATLHSGQGVILRMARFGGDVDVFVDMEEELRGKVPTPEEVVELGRLEAIEREVATIPGAGRREEIDALRRRTQERAERQVLLNELKSKMEYQSVTLIEIGDDYVAFESGDGFVTYLPARRIKSVTKRAPARVAPEAQ